MKKYIASVSKRPSRKHSKLEGDIPLPGGLEEEPLELLDLLGVVVERDLVTSVVLLHEVRDQCTRLPAVVA